MWQEQRPTNDKLYVRKTSDPRSIALRLADLVNKKINLVTMRTIFKNVVLKKGKKIDTYSVSENRGKFKAEFTSKNVKYIYFDDKNRINIRLKDG